MDINQFVKNFASQFDETDIDSFLPETIFRDITEWSSLTALSIIAMVDEEYHVKLTGDDIRSSKTIEDVYNCVKLKI
ncbi:MAG: acyl carrier protein [Bacteroidetes bacterium]|nr:acyl carrier protein [Bacteroidota bacterium]